MVTDLVTNFAPPTVCQSVCLPVCLLVCLLLDGQVSESLNPEGAINTVCDFTSYMPCPGHSCPSLDNFAAHGEDWLALAVHLFGTAFHSPPKTLNHPTLLVLN